MSWPKTPPAWLLSWSIWRWKGQVGPKPVGTPLLVPKWAWSFLRWTEWKRKGSPPPRPEAWPLPIPKWAWQHLIAINEAVPPKVKPPASQPPVVVEPKHFLTTRSGVDFTHPGGETQDAASMKANGFHYAVLNMADGATWSDWTKTWEACMRFGVEPVVGGRPRTIDGCKWQLAEARRLDKMCVLNIEDEFQVGPLTPTVTNRLIIESGIDRSKVLIDTVGWLYNDVDYTPVAHYPVMLQVYWEDMRFAPELLPIKTEHCIFHAREKGFSDIAVQFQSYRSEPSWYAFYDGKPRNYFTGNVIGANQEWHKWPS